MGADDEVLNTCVVVIHGVPTARQLARDGNTVPIDGRYASYYYEVRR